MLRSKSSFLVFLGMLLLTACASKDKTSKKAALYFGAGTQSLMSQQYTDALTSLLKANELDPGNSDILNNLGMAYYFKGEKDLAIRHLQQSLKINEKNSDTKVNLASIHYKAGNIDEAERIYKEVLRDLTYDKQARTYYNLGLLELEKKKNPMTAEAYFKRSIKEDENYCPAYLQLGLIEYHSRKFKEALKWFKESTMGTCYELPSAHYFQAKTLLSLNKTDEAIIKLGEIETRFGKSVYGARARELLVEIRSRAEDGRMTDHASLKKRHEY